MVPVSAHDVLALLVQKGHKRGVLGIEIAPEWQFGLQINAHFIGCLERCFGWAPRVETHVIDAVLPANSEVMSP